jgi:ATP-dependent Lhr-like helicase
LSFTEDEAALRIAAAALSRAVGEGWLGQLAVQKADGEVALTCRLAEILREVGFRAIPRPSPETSRTR